MEKIQKKVREDLTGRRFGRLVVVTPLKNENNELVWQCRCDCGGMTVAKTGQLKAGNRVSCGCSWHVSSIKEGQRYGRLTVLSPTDKRSNRAVIWQCRCDCGKIVEVRSNILRSGRVQSCGCFKAQIDKERFPKSLTYVDDTCIEFLKKISVPSKTSTTGVRGVSLMKNGKYRVELTFQKKRRYFGVYSTLEEAVKVRKKAEIMVEEYLDRFQTEDVLALQKEKG